MIQLKPEIYRLIVKALISPDDETNITSTPNAKQPPIASHSSVMMIGKHQQASLAPLMRVSNILYDICKTELYRDCLVGDIDTFAQDIASNPRKIELLGRVRTLRLYQRDYYLLKEPSYAELITQGKWQLLVPKKESKDCFAGVRQAFLDPEFADRYMSGHTIKALETSVARFPSTSNILARLERVIMSGEAEGFPWGRNQEEYNAFAYSLPPAPVPIFFANLPNVKHYCQWTPTGPLALPNRIIKIDNPPEIVTVHYPHMLEDWGPQWLPPIVLGTTNRYMFRSNNFAASRTDTGEDVHFEQLAAFVTGLMTMLSPHPVLHVKSDGYENVSFDSVSLKKTRLEMYDYIRHTNILNHRDHPPSDLAYIQELFDERIGKWKGKMFLKNREDCPPCSACGFAGHPKKD